MIHYFLEGTLPFNYTDSWRKFSNNVEIKHWNFSNLPINDYPELQNLIDNKKYSVISDFVRRWAIYTYGGIYLDYDVELISDITPLFTLQSFICIEGYPIFANAAVSGGREGNPYQLEMLNDYMDVITGRKKYNVPLEVACATYPLTDYIESKKGGKLDNTDLHRIKKYGGLITFPKEYFYPYNWNEEFTKECITSKTIGIHWWAKSWGK